MDQGNPPADSIDSGTRLSAAEARALTDAISRRALIGGSVAATIAAIVGVDFATAPAARADAPTTIEGVIAHGRSYLTLKFAGMKPLTSGPWLNYSGDWCAWYLSWITRGLGYAGPTGYTANADYWDFLPTPTTAQVGDFARIFNGGGSLDYHIGLVTAVSGGVPTRILDGNRIRPPATSWTNSFVREESNYSPVSLRRPTYSNVAAPGTRRSGMTTRFAKIGSGTGGAGTVVALAGDAGFPCAANWQEYTRNPADGSQADRAAQEFLVHGTVVWIPAAQWDALKLAYTEGPVLGAQTVNLSAADRALLSDIANRLPAPPA